MSLIAFQLPIVSTVRVNVGDDLIYRQISEIMGGERAQHPEADIGGTGTHCQLILMGDLVIIRRKPRGIIPDEIREIAPGSSRDLPEELQVLFEKAGVAAALPAVSGSKANRSEGIGHHKTSQGAAAKRFAGIEDQTAHPHDHR